MKLSKPNGMERAGFTLNELAVVLVMVMLLGALVLPALAGNRANTIVSQCLDNHRRLAGGWLMYATDHDDSLMPNPNWVDVSSGLGWDPAPGGSWYFSTTNFVNPNQSVMAAYVKSAAVYKCPAERYRKLGYPSDRNRSVSLNSNLSSAGGGGTVKGAGPMGDRRYYGTGSQGTGSPAKKMSDLNRPGPAMIFLTVDEHPDSINDATFAFDPGYNNLNEQWRDLPASYHDGGAGISFTDGHAEMHRWVETGDPNIQPTSTTYPVLMKSYGADVFGSPWKTLKQMTRDYEWMDDRTPYQIR